MTKRTVDQTAVDRHAPATSRNCCRVTQMLPPTGLTAWWVVWPLRRHYTQTTHEHRYVHTSPLRSIFDTWAPITRQGPLQRNV